MYHIFVFLLIYATNKKSDSHIPYLPFQKKKKLNIPISLFIYMDPSADFFKIQSPRSPIAILPPMPWSFTTAI